MDKFTTLTGVAAPLPTTNVDTDMIIPKQFLKTIKRTGLGKALFAESRYDESGAENPDFVLNQDGYRGASILVAGENFGCGSSREHAPWALEDYGFRCIIAPSYADIFFNNCFKNGVLPVALDAQIVDTLFDEMYSAEGYSLNIDLLAQTITTPAGREIGFEVDAFRKNCLLNGLDDIGITLQSADSIRSYQQRLRESSPWLFDVVR